MHPPAVGELPVGPEARAAFLAVLTAILVAGAVYAQVQLPRFEATRSGLVLARGLLILVGVAFGLMSASYYANPALPASLVFLSAFGLVHVPAAIILMLKRSRGESPS